MGPQQAQPQQHQPVRKSEVALVRTTEVSSAFPAKDSCYTRASFSAWSVQRLQSASSALESSTTSSTSFSLGRSQTKTGNLPLGTIIRVSITISTKKSWQSCRIVSLDQKITTCYSAWRTSRMSSLCNASLPWASKRLSSHLRVTSTSQRLTVPFARPK